MNLLDYLFDEGCTDPSDLPATPSSEPDLSLWANRPGRDLSEPLAALSKRVGQLNLVIAALVRHCVKQGLVKPDELSALMREIDLEDGCADGELNERQPQIPDWCPSCRAKTTPGKT